LRPPREGPHQLPARRREPRVRAVGDGRPSGAHGKRGAPREHPPAGVHEPRDRRDERGPLRADVRAALRHAIVATPEERIVATEPLAGAGTGVRFAALAVPEFRLYWLASAVSITGDGMENVIRNWLVWELTHSPL